MGMVVYLVMNINTYIDKNADMDVDMDKDIRYGSEFSGTQFKRSPMEADGKPFWPAFYPVQVPTSYCPS